MGACVLLLRAIPPDAPCADQGAPHSVPFDTIDQGTNTHLLDMSGISRFAEVIRDEVAWRHAWGTHIGPRYPSPPLPAVDFANDVVVVVAYGPSNPGTRLNVGSVTNTSNRLLVDVCITAGMSHGPVPAVVTYPYQILTLPRPMKPIAFEWLSQDVRGEVCCDF